MRGGDRADGPSRPSTSRGALAALVGLLALTFLAYAPALRAGFIWDDDDYVTDNPLLVEDGGLARIWTTTETPQYYPLVFTTFRIEHALWGFAPAGYHAVNIALHALDAFLVGLILTRLGARWGWWVAVLFAVHPLEVESVAWITERKNVLSGLFYLGATLAWLRHERDGRAASWLATAALFVAALLSKTVTATLPVALALLVLWREGRVPRRLLWRLAPLVVIGPTMALITVRLETGMVGRVATDFGFSWFERAAVAGRALLFYPWKIVVPWPLSFNYSRWPIEGVTMAALWPWPILVAVAAAAALAWRRGRRGPGCALAFYAVTIVPAIGFLDVYPFRYAFVADHFQYLAGLGILALLAGAVVELGRGRVPPRAGLVGGIAVVAVLTTLTWIQASTYHDAETLWRATLGRNPTSWLANNNLGLLLLERGDTTGAIARFDAALVGKPDAPESLTGRGMALAAAGRTAEALASLDAAIAVDPTYPEARLNRARVLLEAGRSGDAARDLDRFLDSNPDALAALRLRAVARLRAGDAQGAIDDLDRALALGEDADLYNDRGAARMHVGRVAEAESDFSRAIALDPRAPGPLVNRALARARLGRLDAAADDVERAIELDGSSAEAWVVRGRLAAAGGDQVGACRAWRRACQLGRCEDARARCGQEPIAP